jgi:hypothetical protein
VVSELDIWRGRKPAGPAPKRSSSGAAQWAETNKEPPGTRKAFAEAMAAHGHPKEKRQGVRGYTGIALR